MINGIIGICPRCGGELNLTDNLTDAFKRDGWNILAWQHFSCRSTGEFTVTRQTARACLDFTSVARGKLKDSKRELSEDEELLIEFGVQVHVAKTPADFGWEDYTTIAEHAIDDVARHHYE